MKRAPDESGRHFNIGRARPSVVAVMSGCCLLIYRVSGAVQAGR